MFRKLLSVVMPQWSQGFVPAPFRRVQCGSVGCVRAVSAGAAHAQSSRVSVRRGSFCGTRQGAWGAVRAAGRPGRGPPQGRPCDRKTQILFWFLGKSS